MKSINYSHHGQEYKRAIEFFNEKATVTETVLDGYGNSQASLIRMRSRDANAIHAMTGHKTMEASNKDKACYTTSLSDNGAEFYGTKSPKAWNQEIESPSFTLDNLLAEKAKLLSGGIEERLGSILRDCSPIRKRRLSDTEGEWDLQRRWDNKPFMQTYKAQGSMPSLKISASLCFNAGTKSEDITQFAAMTGALASIIDGLGIKTSVCAIYSNSGLFLEGQATPKTRACVTELLIKDYNEYGDASTLATNFHASSFRRTCFNLWGVSGAALGFNLGYGLGHAVEQPVFKDKPGEITFTIQSMRSLVKGDKAELDRLTAAIQQASWGSGAA